MQIYNRNFNLQTKNDLQEKIFQRTFVIQN